MNIGDFNGKLNIYILHGKLHAKNITGHDKTITVNSWETSKITSIQEGEINGGGDLVITKPIDTAKVVLNGWRNITIDNKPYTPAK